MTFEDFDDSKIEMIRNAIEEQTHLRSLQLDRIQVSQCLRTGLLDITAIALSDPFLESSGTQEHRCILFHVRVFTDSDETESEVLWGRVEYSVDREHANFFPVPEEYGKQVTIVFGWEFDRKTLEYKAANVTDRDILHYVSVLPNDDRVAFIECCSQVAERWA